MDDEKKVRIQLEKHLWPDEIVEKKRKRRSKLILATLSMAMFCLGLVVGLSQAPQNRTVIQGNNGYSVSSKIDSVYNLLRNNWYFASEDENIEQHLVDRALYGMSSSSVDLHTSYMSREEVEGFTSSIDMGFVGIGVQYNTTDGLNLITRVFHNSPAEKAGVLPGDIIYSVDGELCADLDSDEIVNRVRGVEGSEVIMQFLRDNEIIELTITRGTVQNTAFGEMLDESVGYLQIYQFGSSTGDEVAGYLEMMSQQGLRELIIDLRDDGGGYLDALVSVASSFLPQGTIVMKQVYADGTVEYSKAKKGMFENIENIVILVNEDTASAAEVLTLALKEQRDDVVVMGTTTYGKGTVQITHTFSDGSALKYTTAKWLSPNDVWVNGVGITPDIEVRLHDVLYMSYAMMEEGTVIEADTVSATVQLIQQSLDFLGYPVNRMDGYFDTSTLKALTEFQKEFGLTRQGSIDSETLEAVLAQVTKKWALDDSSDIQLQKAIEVLHE